LVEPVWAFELITSGALRIDNRIRHADASSAPAALSLGMIQGRDGRAETKSIIAPARTGVNEM